MSVELRAGNWRVRLRLPDGTRPAFECPATTKTKEQAELFEQALRSGLKGTSADPAIHGETLGAWAIRWLDERERTHRDAGDDRQRWRCYWSKDPISAADLRAISPAALADAADRVVQRDLARQTTRNAWTTLRSCLRDAARARLLPAAKLVELKAIELPPLDIRD